MRVLRLMRENGLLAPQRAVRRRGSRAHDGVITTERPNEMWGTDATSVLTLWEGQAVVFVVVDHCTSECLALRAFHRGTRREARQTLRDAVVGRFGGYGAHVAKGVRVRHDHGSCFMADEYQSELDFLGMEASPAFIREPEGNGVAERFIRTLKEQLLWVQHFRTVEELDEALGAFRERYNREWLVAKHGHISPAEAYARLCCVAQAA